MKKLLKDQIQKTKLEIKNRYLAGESVPSIANDFEVVSRTIYFHLGKLTAQEKGMHAMNSSMRKGATKVSVEEVLNEREQEPEQSRRVEFEERRETSLVDFIQG